jgi:hypothetical protein
MKFVPTKPPRVFKVGESGSVGLRDCGRIRLDGDEQVTFVTQSGAEYDVVRKSWGYYATPSLNGRLSSFGLRAVLVKGADGKCFILLVEKDKTDDFLRYLNEQCMEPVCWLDSDSALDELQKKLRIE